MRRGLVAPWLLAMSVYAGADDLRGGWDAALYLQADSARARQDGPLNPGLARLDEDRQTLELRANLKLDGEAWHLGLRPILSLRHDDLETGAVVRQGYLSQWQWRLRLTEHSALSLGREPTHWGPAQFRSPSSPFYFDNGRADPSRELSGVDDVKLAWTPDAKRVFSLAYVQDRGHAAPADDPWRDTWLARGEWRGAEGSLGLALAKAPERGAFLGAYAQWTASDAWLLYAEAASSTQAAALQSPAEPARPFALVNESARRGVVLLGATRTLENGQSLTLEWLHNGHGFTPAESAALFGRAADDPGAAGLALGHLPALLGRDYLHLVWQSNPLDSGTYWRLMASHNLDDASSQWAAYVDHPLNGHLSLYALGVANTGGGRGEFAALLERSLSVGVRLALP